MAVKSQHPYDPYCSCITAVTSISPLSSHSYISSFSSDFSKARGYYGGGPAGGQHTPAEVLASSIGFNPPPPPAQAPDFVAQRGTYKVEKLGVDWDPDNDNEAAYRQKVEYADANLVGSKTDLEEDGHLPCIDLDLPARLQPSTTPGHYHLYINKVVAWDKYVNLLEAMRDAGLVSEKYVEMSVKRGQTFVRKPYVFKNPGEEGS